MLFKSVVVWPLSENMPQKKCLCQETCVLSWLFQAFLFYYYFVSLLMQRHQTWKKNIHTKIVLWNGLFKQLLVTVNSKTKKIKREAKRNSWITWLRRDQPSKPCLFCLAFLADAAQVTQTPRWEDRSRCDRHWWTWVLVCLSASEPTCWVWASISQVLLAGKAPSNSFALSVVPC